MTRPSFADYGTHDESAFPELWEGVVGAWAPCLGPTGLRLHDFSRLQNWGTLNNMTPATAWQVSDGQFALDYTVTPGLGVSIANNPALDLLGGFSGACWIYPRVVTGASFQTLFAKRVGASTPTACNYQLYLGNNDGVLSYFNLTQYRSAVTPAANRWHHCAFTRSAGSVLTLYLDGVSIYTASGVAAVTNAGDLVIGARPTLDLEQPNGLIDGVTLWSRCLAENEIRNLYIAGRGGMYQRRRRATRYFVPQLQFRRRQYAQLVGGGTV